MKKSIKGEQNGIKKIGEKKEWKHLLELKKLKRNNGSTYTNACKHK